VPRSVPDPCPDTVLDAALGRARGETYWRLRLAADTGLRRAELAAVCDTDVRDTVSGPALRVVGKGGAVRLVPVPSDLADWLRMRHGPAFGMTPAAVGEWYVRHLGRNVHSLRHRYATKVYAATHDLTAVQRLLGHASVSTTQVYVACADDTLAHAAAQVWQRPRLRAV
jgi:integrase